MTAPQISRDEWTSLLQPYLGAAPHADLVTQLESYLQLLLRWNDRMNLTAIRDSREMIRRHFGESLFLARHVPRGTSTLVDHGSGAGFPGVPVALTRPEISITLSESQSKKASFLREAIRVLGLQNACVHSGRTEDLLSKFDVAVLRAVDDSNGAHATAMARVASGGSLIALEGADRRGEEPVLEVAVPGSVGVLRVYRR